MTESRVSMAKSNVSNIKNSVSLESTINDFNDDFSNQRLDSVMNYFSNDAEFRGPDGSVAKGKENIRKAFQRLFDGAYGQVTFLPTNMIIDEDKREVSFVWHCQHNMVAQSELGYVNRAIFSFMKSIYGQKFYWEGVDYFIFNDDYKIISKQTYGKITLPKFIKGSSRASL